MLLLSACLYALTKILSYLLNEGMSLKIETDKQALLSILITYWIMQSNIALTIVKSK